MLLCERCGEATPLLRDDPTTKELEDELAQIDILMERLSQRRTALRRKINNMSAILLLPREILLEIFSLVCEPERLDISVPPVVCTSASPSPDNASCPPLFLGSICAAWRSLAWNTPLLWRTVKIEVSVERERAQARLLSDWLLRAQTLRLNIKLSARDEDDDIFQSIRNIIEVLLTRAEYWGTIDSLLPPQCHDILATHQFPMLTSVRFRPPKGTISTFSQPPSMFSSTPLLSEVDLSGYDFSSMDLPWKQLRKFRTHFLSIKECVQVLDCSPNLVYCHLDHVYCTDRIDLNQDVPDGGMAATPDPNPTPTQLVHTGLEALEVTFIKGTIAGSFLQGVSLSGLKELTMHYLDTVSIASFIARSSPTHLRKLSLWQCRYEDEGMVRCLEDLPNLVEFILHVQPVFLGSSFFGGGGLFGAAASQGLSESLVRRLYPFRTDQPPSDSPYVRDAGSIILPNLRSFTYTGFLSCSTTELLNMLIWRAGETRTWEDAKAELRYGPVRFLKSAHILAVARTFPLSRTDEERLARLREKGIYVEQRRTGGTWS